jgi:PHD/YefM family antitoxin component YafN of YafNO toxin-antitoxin module
MQQFSASQAKQNFGELMDAVALGPVAIARHNKVRAIVCTPEAFGGKGTAQAGQLAERRAARAAQALVDKDRLIRHQRLAIELLLLPKAGRDKLLARARQEVARWRRERLCSDDYSDRWDALLALPVAELARAMGADTLDWGQALRQNSPWPVATMAAA